MNSPWWTACFPKTFGIKCSFLLTKTVVIHMQSCQDRWDNWHHLAPFGMMVDVFRTGDWGSIGRVPNISGNLLMVIGRWRA